MTVDDLNALDRENFIAALGWIFEDSPWVAERTWTARPFADLDALHTAMVGQLMRAKREELLALLCAHPNLGTRARISPASTDEQAGAGLDQLTPQEFEFLQEMNSAYLKKFGFPFLYAVKGSTKHDILRALQLRLGASPEEEFDEALRQVQRIARFRLLDNVSDTIQEEPS
jgi:2-oxo-4-hydroxy-4-carboxy-5-ureidoimidazoline decarboxylase